MLSEQINYDKFEALIFTDKRNADPTQNPSPLTKFSCLYAIFSFIICFQPDFVKLKFSRSFAVYFNSFMKEAVII